MASMVAQQKLVKLLSAEAAKMKRKKKADPNAYLKQPEYYKQKHNTEARYKAFYEYFVKD